MERGGGEGGEAVDFGFRRVTADEKPALVRGLFADVAERYDLMNDLMSLGVHRLWKAALVDALDPRPGQRLLDLAGGTGDLALAMLDRIEARRAAMAAAEAEIVVCDLTPAMIERGRDRALDRGRTAGIRWVCGDAETLPFPDLWADGCAVAFGLRNVARLERALGEIRRVLKPGGRFLCLEFSHVAVPLLGALYDRYSFAVLPALGRLVTGNAHAYRYLAESIRRFPAQDELARRMEAAGFERVSVRNLSGGIAALHGGWRL